MAPRQQVQQQELQQQHHHHMPSSQPPQQHQRHSPSNHHVSLQHHVSIHPQQQQQQLLHHSSTSSHVMGGSLSFSSAANRAQTEREQKKVSKEQFLMFIKVLMKYLEKKDPMMHSRAKQVIRECAERNKKKERGFESVTASMKTPLRKTVGESYWNRAEEYLKLFQAKMLERKMANVRLGGGSSATKASSSQVPRYGQPQSSQQQAHQVQHQTVQIEREQKKIKEQFLMFIKVMMKYLEKKDPMMHSRAKQVIQECAKRNKKKEHGFESVTASMKTPLRKTVGELYWKQAEGYLTHFQAKMLEREMANLLVGGGSLATKSLSSQVPLYGQPHSLPLSLQQQARKRQAQAVQPVAMQNQFSERQFNDHRAQERLAKQEGLKKEAERKNPAAEKALCKQKHSAEKARQHHETPAKVKFQMQNMEAQTEQQPAAAAAAASAAIATKRQADDPAARSNRANKRKRSSSSSVRTAAKFQVQNMEAQTEQQPVAAAAAASAVIATKRQADPAARSTRANKRKRSSSSVRTAACATSVSVAACATSVRTMMDADYGAEAPTLTNHGGELDIDDLFDENSPSCWLAEYYVDLGLEYTQLV